MNINLASRVTGYRIDAYGVNQYKRLQDDQNTQLIEVDGITENISILLQNAGIITVLDLMEADEESLLEIKGVTPLKIEKVYSSVQEFVERKEPSIIDEDSRVATSEDFDEEE